jgi:nicotinate-nucleotide pyrophosphorylase (carboxylating)
MFKQLLGNPDILELIDIAIREDIGDGDHTSLACIDNDIIREAYCIAKQDGVIVGVELASFLFKKIDTKLVFNPHLNDGDATLEWNCHTKQRDKYFTCWIPH